MAAPRMRTVWLGQDINNPRIKDVYENQLQQTQTELAELIETFEVSVQREYGRDPNLSLTDGTTESRAASSANAMGRLQRAHEVKVIRRITDSEIRQHYDQLIKERDPRLVNVRLLKEKSAPLWESHENGRRPLSAERLQEVQRMIDDDRPIDEILQFSYRVMTIHVLDEPRWTLADSAHLNGIDPSDIKVGDFVGPFLDGNSEFLTYIADERIYPQIHLGQKIELSASNYAEDLVKADLLAAKLTVELAQLVKEHKVLVGGKPFGDAPKYWSILNNRFTRHRCDVDTD